jgi:hypothetical protein
MHIHCREGLAPCWTQKDTPDFQTARVVLSDPAEGAVLGGGPWQANLIL